ncbi:MAG TPA: lipoprotein [Usitatibacter sp.]|jgi:predicted small lipoprotein YifL|nr:lipoprotein [Usitatibacter sp.]HSW84031.1 lipoprotein [Usitatibacter sp.]
MIRALLAALALACIATVPACGQKGPLKLPEAPPAKPASP